MYTKLSSKLKLPSPQEVIERVQLGWARITNRSFAKKFDPFVIDRTLRRNPSPYIKRSLLECSLEEDEENPFYTGLLNTLSNHCCGKIPVPICLIDDDAISDTIEDRFIEWGIHNQIGSALREMRRVAARSGVAALIPYRMNTDYDLKLGFQVVGAEYFASPALRPDVEDGIEYYKNGDIKAVWIQETDKYEPTRYVNSISSSDAKKCIVWSRKRVQRHWPECSSAFTMYPSIRRYIANVLKGQENQTSIPMAIELDPQVYPQASTQGIPTGAYEYEPGFIPTLPPGTKLSGLNFAAMAEDRSKFIDLMVGSAARCIDMPTILALADSSDSNMATAHIDLQPWKYAVEIDRFDFEVVVRKAFFLWFEMAKMWPDYLDSKAMNLTKPPIIFNYSVLFEHPDPQKRANARETDLASGSSTLTRIYSEQGLTARREIKKECKLLGITPKQYFKLLMSSRNKQVANGTNKTSNESETSTKQRVRSQGA